MNNLFFALFCISYLCIAIFIMWAIINLIWKKPATKYFVFTGMSALVMIVSFIAFGLTTDEPASERSTIATNDVPVTAEASVSAEHEDTPIAKPSSDTAAAVLDNSEPEAKSSLDFNVSFSDTYPNDVTGNWRLATITENKKIEEYAVDYYNRYIKSDNEIHIIINFTLNTTSCIMTMGNLMYVTTTEYVDNEEHNAKLACTGMLLSEYCINIATGEMEKIQ